MSEVMAMCLTMLIQSFLFIWAYNKREKDQTAERERMLSAFSEEEKEWRVERQQLLDRIQASSFTEYKQAEVKVEKAKREMSVAEMEQHIARQQPYL